MNDNGQLAATELGLRCAAALLGQELGYPPDEFPFATRDALDAFGPYFRRADGQRDGVVTLDGVDYRYRYFDRVAVGARPPGPLLVVDLGEWRFAANCRLPDGLAS